MKRRSVNYLGDWVPEIRVHLWVPIFIPTFWVLVMTHHLKINYYICPKIGVAQMNTRHLWKMRKTIIYWPNSLDCTDLNQCGVRRDAELCRLCYKQRKTKLSRGLGTRNKGTPMSTHIHTHLKINYYIGMSKNEYILVTYEKNKILMVVLELPIQPIENGPNGLKWHCLSAGSSKTSHRILIFSIAMGAEFSF